MTLQDKIAHLRNKNGQTYEDIAQIVGVTKSTVRRWEVGIIKDIRRDKIEKLAEALGTTPAYLLDWEEKKPATMDELFAELNSLMKSFTPSQTEEVLRFAKFLSSSQQNQKTE